LMEADHFDRTKFGMTAVEMLGDDQIFDRLVLFLKKKVKAKEIASIRAAVDQINEEAGLEAVKGELFPPQADPELNHSQETAPTSSQSLSPLDTVEETGA
jgi:hypothetical protein